MSKRTSDEFDFDQARPFEQVLGHELYYIKRKRAGLNQRAGSTQKARPGSAAADAGTEYRGFHDYERLCARLEPGADAGGLLATLGQVGKEATQIAHKASNWVTSFGKTGDKPDPQSSPTDSGADSDQRPTAKTSAELKRLQPELEAAEDKVYRDAWNENLTGLALSGGGIRSATFNLGFLQALANLGCLKRLDYLSTVSGGGYIGGWLTALIDRANRQPDRGGESGIESVEKRIRTHPLDGGGGASDATERSPGESDPEDRAITFLRRYSNYLTPKTGLLSADTWSAVATYVRNVVLNLVILVAAIGALLLGVRLLAALLASLGWLDWLVVVALGLSLISGVTLGHNFRSLLDGKAAAGDTIAPSHDQGHLLKWFIAPLAAAAVLISPWLPPDGAGGNGSWWAWMVLVGVAHGASWLVVAATACRREDRLTPVSAARCAIGSMRQPVWQRLVLSAVLAGLIGGWLLWLIAGVLDFGALGLERHASLVLQLTLGAPLVLVWLYALAVLHTGMMGTRLTDGQREWLSRLGAWLMIVGLGWLAFFGVALFGPLLYELLGDYMRLALTSGWLLTTLGGILASRGSAHGQGAASSLRKILILLAPYVFVVGFVAALAAGVNSGLGWSTGFSQPPVSAAPVRGDEGLRFFDRYPYERHENRDFGRVLTDYLNRQALSPNHGRNLGIIVIWVALLSAIAWLQSRIIDINEFSMHRFYGNRLTRCYLGASVDPDHREKHAQPFTGFYPGDDILLAGRDRRQAENDSDLENRHLIIDEPGPFPIVNTAINLVAGDELAWQQRMAASFTTTPLYCGFEPAKASKPRHAAIDRFGYRPTARLGGKPGLTLGMVMTTSGAAASPNMGYHTTPAFAFLMTVFNVRLGRWVGNPRHRDKWTHSGPESSLGLLFSEVFGLTRGDTEYVYLSDGGHFDNLGVYELVKRRCRFIIACDVGADPQFKFEDLGNTIRKCRIDLGVDIRIGVDQIRERSSAGFSRWHCAMGDIYYPDGDGGGSRGKLLYIKSSLSGDEPEDVINYAKEHAAFPHEPTGDQFFDEAQFESYRRLGEHIGTEVLGCCSSAGRDDINIESAFVNLDHRWHPPLPQGQRFTQLSKRIGELFDELRGDGDLAFLDAQMYPEWRFLRDHGVAPTRGAKALDAGDPAGAYVGALSLPRTEKEFRAGFYFCNSLIQLMEDVYLDLELENQWRHPDNRGWMNLFKHWSWVGIFRATWAVCAATYGRRFQEFCERHLGLELGETWVDGPYQVGNRKQAFALWNKLNASGSIPNEESVGKVLASLFEKGDEVALNLVELSQILAYVKKRSKKYRLYQLEVRLKHPSHNGAEREPLFHFVFGYALVNGRGGIELFRVQDHLRKMGLARGALAKLLEVEPRLSIEALPEDIGDPDFSPESRRSFVNLFRSAERQRAADQ